MSTPVIEVQHLTKEFRLGQLSGLGKSLRDGLARLRGQTVVPREMFKALDDVNFSIRQGEVVGIIGHNGAGKSTLLKTLAGISQATRGKVHVEGRVAPLIEVGAGLVADMTGRENVFLNAAILGMSRRDIRRKFDEIVNFAEMEKFIDTPIKRYSSGMQIRLAFAIATAVDADVLIVDEVLAVGDLAFQRKCFDRMEDLIRRQGRTVLLVSHNIRQVERLCTRAILLDHGRAILDGEPRDVCNVFYDTMDQKVHEGLASAGPGLGRRESSGDIELQALKIFDTTGREIERTEYMGDFNIEVTFQVRHMIQRPSFGIGVHTTDFLYLATSQSIDVLKVPQLEPGVHTVRYAIRGFPFLPGVYSFRVGVALGDSFQALLYVENVGKLLVTSAPGSRAVASQKSEGFVALEGEWSLSTLPKDACAVGPQLATGSLGQR
ncbi:ABC transporter ATP-binding protein [Methyloversatilis sp. XJ19-13]|uniref:ABC transporter ATP-binding protein n=1 Tax=Methyloversatilis sp. XJ19-13 TaxID=2963430 RepID=UPI00211C520F|nr:ABC transporter ATP-binding protein [Methyloversatilis sp. XJ19-13]MCQ9372930.1 ABC transporter ATP-binding protein [Methyloversatilis sp. XJ19-13]